MVIVERESGAAEFREVKSALTLKLRSLNQQNQLEQCTAARSMMLLILKSHPFC